ncbi:MAG: Peptidoglycan glycosyltransferase [Candidatus Daviesbacteria bacterium GW2011_GWF2_38_6]|uniref:Peptidoglycan glycosyltransferase n=1 Tax=Candidatus Daviesbacteria bacterium GW2011_GWF2_38_6 TaxID=1618432 RepID=A0A0G0NN07_9BACT|nr:MAG: Peptidoglycan glycosyltransferase [Candidatus Daviesbacteria bacterium GW2011_GWF2_38_6]
MDPKTGAILALASFPSYDPIKYFSFSSDYYKNPIVADTYEPGSTFKVLVMAAALNEELVEPDTTCDICNGPVQLGGFAIRTWNNKYYPDTTMKDVIIHSDNTGMVFTGMKLGLDKFHEYLENYGFGEPSDIDLQDESSPDLRPKDEWREIDLATASFGQGIAITPIQMVRAVASIANGGYLMEPHVVREIKDEKNTFEIKPKMIRQVIKENTAKIMTEMMVKAVDEGEAKWAKPKGFKIAGKTGTAQIPVAGHYDPNKTIASFVGFAPADDPKFVMLVLYNQPSSSIFGSETAAPTFFEIAKELFVYYKIAPTE